MVKNDGVCVVPDHYEKGLWKVGKVVVLSDVIAWRLD